MNQNEWLISKTSHSEGYCVCVVVREPAKLLLFFFKKEKASVNRHHVSRVLLPSRRALTSVSSRRPAGRTTADRTHPNIPQHQQPAPQYFTTPLFDLETSAEGLFRKRLPALAGLSVRRCGAWWTGSPGSEPRSRGGRLE